MASIHMVFLLLMFLYYLSPTYSDCPTPTCNPEDPYRTFDGSCNNLDNPTWGMPNTPYSRLLPPNYGDGVSSPTLDTTKRPLPSARSISTRIYPDVPVSDLTWTLLLMQYSQFLAHDMSNSKLGGPDNCCSTNVASHNEKCYPIPVPLLDEMHLIGGKKCISFLRTTNTNDEGCYTDNNPVEQITDVNSLIDLAPIYGNDDARNQKLRSGSGGKLIVEERYNQAWPPRDPNSDETCWKRKDSEACYFTGDDRANQNPELAVLQIIYLREHNRICDALAKLNPTWDDEKLFQTARKICIAMHQRISYYEMLPIFLGKNNLLDAKIIYNTKDFVDDYDKNVNPGVLNEHATAAFRYFHTLIQGVLLGYSEGRLPSTLITLSEWLLRPSILEENKGKNFCAFARGLTTQNGNNDDLFHTREITAKLFRNGSLYGNDLKAADIQRNRAHGLASYNSYREYCGLTKANGFFDLSGEISYLNILQLKTIYKSVEDVELTVGGSLENHEPGTQAGPTFNCIFKEQFLRSRTGDRFWFENGGAAGLTSDQLAEIHKATISKVICDNSPGITSMQPRGFEVISFFSNNNLTPCRNLPSVDLSKWKED